MTGALTEKGTRRSPSSSIHIWLLLWQQGHQVNGWKMSLTNKHQGGLLCSPTKGACDLDQTKSLQTKSHFHFRFCKKDVLNTRLCPNLILGGRPGSLAREL